MPPSLYAYVGRPLGLRSALGRPSRMRHEYSRILRRAGRGPAAARGAAPRCHVPHFAVLQRLVVALAGAGAAQDPAALHYLPLEVDAFPAFGAGHASGLVTRHVLRAETHPHPLDIEQLFVRHLAIGAHLLLIPVFDLRIQLAGALLRALLGCYPNGAV